MMQNRDKKKKRGGSYIRLALLIVILLILLVLLFGERWGIGQGDLLRLVNRQSPAPEVETPSDRNLEDADRAREVRVTVTGNAIQVNEMPYTLEGFDAYLDTLDDNVLIVLRDEEANYTLFSTIEGMFGEKEVSYVIEE